MEELNNIEIIPERGIVNVFPAEQAKAKKQTVLNLQVERFSDRLTDTLDPTLSAKELIEKMVKAALEIEFSRNFTLSPGFAKMVNVIADTIVCNPQLRRQALSTASIYLEKKLEAEKQ